MARVCLLLLTLTIIDNIIESIITIFDNREEAPHGPGEIPDANGADVLYSAVPAAGVLRHGHHGPGHRHHPGTGSGPGTLYNLLESFVQAGYIAETKVEGRKRSYLITEVGQKALGDEYRRLRTLAADYENLTGGGEA